MDVDTFRTLLRPPGQRLLELVAPADVPDDAAALALGSRLRRDHPPDLVAAALTQASLRRKARRKFGADADVMYFTPDGLEQATGSLVAGHRARRFVDRGRVADLCCGIGGDLVALARAGVSVTGVDRDPLTAEVARANLAVLGQSGPVECADVQSYDLTGYDAIFCDPARRTARGRTFDPGSYSPPWPWAAKLLTRDAAVKAAPGIPHELIPDGVEAEWVSVGGELREATLWSGVLASGVPRRATLLPGGATLVPASLAPPPVGPAGPYLFEPDPAVIRAHLVAEVAAAVDGRLLDGTIAYVTSDRLVSTPFAKAYAVTDVLPFQLKRLRALLRERGVGSVTVKKRGSAISPQQLRAQLRLTGDGHATVVLTRCAGAPTVLLVQPCPP